MKMQLWVRAVIVSTLTAFAVGATVMPSSAATRTIIIEAYKDSQVLRDSPDQANPPPPSGVPADSLNVWRAGLAYMAFDLSVLPAGATITAASFGAVDLRTTSSQFVSPALVDVPADWDETGLTFNMALANYGAALTTGFTPERAIVDPAKKLWMGRMTMNANPIAEVFSISHGAEGFTDQDFLNGLNAELTTGDGLAVMILEGRSDTNNYTASRENADYTGPRLHLTYVPEPSTVALSALAAVVVAAAARRRDRS